MVPLVVAVSVGLVLTPSEAAFHASLAAPGNQFGSGIWACSTPGVRPVTVVGDAWATEDAPDTTFATSPTLLVDGDRPRARGYLEVDLTPPVGCVAGAAELVIEVVSAVPSERVQVRGVTADFDAGAVTWSSRPPVGADRARADADVGEVRIDVTDLLDAGLHGFELAVDGEDADDDLDDGDVGSFQVGSLESAGAPRLFVEWREP